MTQVRQLRHEGHLVFQAAQVEQQPVLGHAADHRQRQAAQGHGQFVESAAAALLLLRLEGQAGRRQPLHRQRAGADLSQQRHHAHAKARRHGFGHGGQQRPGHGVDGLRRPREQAQRGQVLRQALGAQVQAQRGFERRQRQLAHAQCALHGEPADTLHGLPAADDEPGLRPPQQLVAAEGDHVAAGRQHLLRQRLARQPVSAQVHQRAAAQVGGQRQALRMGNARERRLAHRRGEPLDRVVAGVHLHQERGAFADGAFVVVRVGAVGGAHFDQRGAGGGHHVGHAEGAADLDQFAARDDDLPAPGQRGDGEQHRGGVVVDHRRGFSAGEGAQELLDDRIAVAAAAGGQVVLEVVGAAHHRQQVLQGRVCQQRAAQVGVDHRAGEVEHRTHARREALRHALLQRVAQRLGRHGPGFERAGLRLRPQALEQRTGFAHHQRVAVFGHQRGHRLAAQQAVYGGEVLGGGLGTVHHGFVGPAHQVPPGSGGGSAASSPNSSIRLTPCRCLPASDTSRSRVSVARSSATGSTSGSRPRWTILR